MDPATTGLGPLAHPARRGLLVHSVLAATPTGVPLGLLDQEVWARDAATEAGVAERMFSVLMGEDVERRRQFIEEHALEVKNLDV